jgi:Plavaka transposase
LAPLIDKALDMWVSQIANFGGHVPWKNSKELYATIDGIQHGHSPWVVHKICYQGPLPPGTVPKWMTQTYDLCAQDTHNVLHYQLETTHFKDKINLTPYRQFDESGQRIWSNLMSADWAWTQAVRCKDSYAFILLICEYVTGNGNVTGVGQEGLCYYSHTTEYMILTWCGTRGTKVLTTPGLHLCIYD